MRKSKIQITHGDTKSVSVHEAEFEDDEILKLEKFLEYARDLEKLSLVRSGDFGSFNVQYEVGMQPAFSIRLPADEPLAALLHKLRRFILNDEPTSYNRITGIIKRRFRDPHPQSVVDFQRLVFDGRANLQQIQVRINGVLLNSEETLTKWLNTFGEYHENFEERKELEAFREVLPDEGSRVIILRVLAEKVSAILSISDFVELILGKTTTLQIRALRV